MRLCPSVVNRTSSVLVLLLLFPNSSARRFGQLAGAAVLFRMLKCTLFVLCFATFVDRFAVRSTSFIYKSLLTQSFQARRRLRKSSEL